MSFEALTLELLRFLGKLKNETCPKTDMKMSISKSAQLIEIQIIIDDEIYTYEIDDILEELNDDKDEHDLTEDEYEKYKKLFQKANKQVYNHFRAAITEHLAEGCISI